jgi:hypothetical protein
MGEHDITGANLKHGLQRLVQQWEQMKLIQHSFDLLAVLKCRVNIQ